MSSYSELMGNDAFYMELKKNFKRKYSMCRICRRYTPYKLRTLDHVIPMWQYNGSPYDESNWQMLCTTCHKLKTILEGQP